MAKISRGKRPCSICRKWFQPDVRQKGRQRTCGTVCRRELRRRGCQKWNKKNKEYCQHNYLDKKIEMVKDQESQSGQTDAASLRQVLPKNPTQPIFPYEIIAEEYGKKNLIILQYLVYQIMKQAHKNSAGAT